MNKHRFGLIIGTLIGVHSAVNDINGIVEEQVSLGTILRNEIVKVFGTNQQRCSFESTRSFKNKLLAVQRPELNDYIQGLIKNFEDSDVTAMSWGIGRTTNATSKHVYDRQVVLFTDRIRSIVDYLMSSPENNPHWMIGATIIVRFILYHEYRHFCQTARPIYTPSMVEFFELDADNYAANRLMAEMFDVLEKICN